jgi:VWFA-related protein
MEASLIPRPGRKKMRRNLGFFLLFSISVVLIPFAWKNLESQEKGAQKELQHDVVVTLKLIQVYVTDLDGNPVTDLRKEDFVLRDNGEPKTITDFETHFIFLEQKKPAPARVAEEPIQPEPPPPPAQLSRKFFLFLDIQRNDPIGMMKAKRVARFFVENQIQPGDEVGVFSFQPAAGFVLHEYLTTDKEKMYTAIKKARALPVYSLFGELAVEPGQLLVGSSGGAGGAGGQGKSGMEAGLPAPEEGPGWAALYHPLYVFFYALEDLSQSLQYISGIKNIVLFSRGAGAKSTFDILGKMLASANCRVYTVDTNWKRHYLKGYFESGMGAALKQLAISSGGKHFEDPDDIETIANDIQQMTGNYYVLGYYIRQEWDGAYHEVEVEVKRQDCEVYAQKGYFNPKPFSEFSEGEKRLHLADITLNDTPYFEAPEPFPLEALPFPGKEAAKLVLLSEVRPENLEDVFLNDTEFITLVLDEDDTIIDARRAVLKQGAASQTPIHHYSITRLNPGIYECRVVIRNLETGKSALGASSVEVPEFGEAALQIYPLFLLIPEKESFYVRAVSEEKKVEKEALSLDDLYPYLSSRHSPIVTEMDRSVRRIFGLLRFTTGISIEHTPDVDIELVHSQSGRKFSLEFFILESKKFGLDDTMLLEIRLPSVEPDVYALNMTLSDPQSGFKAVTSRTFRIR